MPLHKRYARLHLDRLEPCPRLAAALAVPPAVAAGASWLSAPPPIAAAVTLGLSFVAWVAVSGHVLRRGRRACTGLRLDENGEIAVRLRAGDSWQVAQPGHVLVARRLVAMRLRLGPPRRDVCLCLTPGSVDRQRWRQLRAALMLRFPGA